MPDQRSQVLVANDRTTITHCIHGLGLGGAQQIVRLLVAKGDCSRFRHLVYAAEDGVFREILERSGASVRIMPRRMRKFDVGHIRLLGREMRRDPPSLVHCHLFGDSLHGFLAARRVGDLPVLMTLHTAHDNLTVLQRLGYRWLLRRVTCTVACSQSVRSSFLTAWGDEAAAVLCIPNGIDVAFGPPPDSAARERLRRRLGLDSETVVIASIGRMEAPKAQHHLISAFARLARSAEAKPRLLFLGEGSLRPKLERQTRREGVAELVQFVGFRPDVEEILPVIDVVAFSSLTEGLSVAMLEAMAAARCIVGTDVPGITQAVRAEREGLIVAVGDVSGLCEALRRAVTSPALRERLGTAAQRRFHECFQAERMVASYEQLYSDLLGPTKVESRGSAPAV